MNIRVEVRSNFVRKQLIVDNTQTIKQVFDAEGIDYTRGQWTLDGMTLPDGGLDRTFESYRVTDHCYLTSVVKSDNA